MVDKLGIGLTAVGVSCPEGRRGGDGLRGVTGSGGLGLGFLGDLPADPHPCRGVALDPFLAAGGRDGWTIYDLRALPVYGTDDDAKLAQQLELLAAADAVVISINRAVASVPRMQRPYPVQLRLYELLGEGRLGYRVAGVWTSWPRQDPVRRHRARYPRSGTRP